MICNSWLNIEKESQIKQGLASQIDEVKMEILSKKDVWEETKTDLKSTLEEVRAELSILQKSENDGVDGRFNQSEKLKTNT